VSIESVKIEDIDSSTISWFEYSEEIKRLTVAFRGGGIYVYEDVPIDAFKLMRDATYDDTASVGGTFHRVIKGGGFKYRRFEEIGFVDKPETTGRDKQ
jgi:hypothetical protein